MGKYTRIDIALGMLKMINIGSVNDIRKLTLPGHLCCLSPQSKVKEVLLYRLCNFMILPFGVIMLDAPILAMKKIASFKW